MVGIDEAQEAVLHAVGRHWGSEEGALVIDKNSLYENADVYTMAYGAREFIEDGDPEYSRFGDPVAVVSKHDGSVSFYPGGPPPLSDIDTKFPDRHKVVLPPGRAEEDN